MSIARVFKHLLYPPWLVKRYFPPESLVEIEATIKASELLHSGEVRFAVESALDWRALFSEEPCRARGIEVFSELGIWDTEQNNGVLIYLLLADHGVEIVADRGINRVVEPSEWQRICRLMEAAFRQGLYLEGVVDGIKEIEKILIAHFPPTEGDINELPNQPVVLK